MDVSEKTCACCFWKPAIVCMCIKINGMYYPFHRVEDYPHALKKIGQMAEKLSLWKNMEPSQQGNASGKKFSKQQFQFIWLP